MHLIMAVRVEASGVGTRAKLQYATALRMALCRFWLRYEPVPMGCSEALSKLSWACRLVG